MRDQNYLFCNFEWFFIDQHQREQLMADLDGMDGDRLLNTSVEDLSEYFQKKYRVDVPVLRVNDIVADQSETEIDVSHDPGRDILRRPHKITGTAIEVTVPFDGEGEVFRIKPTTYTLNPPRAEVRDGELVLRVQGISLTAEEVRAEINRTLSQIQQYLTTLRKDAQGLNDQLSSFSRSAIERRREKLLQDRNLLGSLGFRMKKRAGAPRTYVAPEVRRKLSPVMLKASGAPFKPEPTLSDPDYEHILGVIQNMAHVMEWSPSAFVSMDEEALRSHFLVQLNGHYEGQATGETFNYQGKTDILIRSQGRTSLSRSASSGVGPRSLPRP